MKGNLDFVAFLEKAFARGDWYILGGFGNILTLPFIEAKCRQYDYNAAHRSTLISKIGHIGHDCYGLLKAYVWDNEDGEGNYNQNGCPDRNEASAKIAAVEKGTLETIPRIPGVCVWKNGHVGFVVDCSPANYTDWIVIENYGVETGMLRRKLSAGGWTSWFKDTYLSYVTEPVGGTSMVRTHTIVRGDTFWALAKTYGTTVAAIKAANPRVDPDALTIGSVINIPGGEGTETQTEEIRRLTATLEDVTLERETLRQELAKVTVERDSERREVNRLRLIITEGSNLIDKGMAVFRQK